MKTPARRIFERGNSIYLIIGEEYTSLFRSKYGYLESLLSGKFSKSLHKILLRDGKILNNSGGPWNCRSRRINKRAICFGKHGGKFGR
jgi:hypothetical protein